MSDFNDALSRDAIFNGKVTIRQRVKGYRFSIDALLLAWYVSVLPGNRALDLGTGCGVISLALAYKRPELKIDAIEIQKRLARLANENVKRNKFRSINITNTDLRELKGSEREGKYDFVFSNPPFRAVGRGRLNPEKEKALARHEIKATLSDVLECSARSIKSGGFIGLINLAERLAELERMAEDSGLPVQHKCLVKPYPDKSPNLILTLIGQKRLKTQADCELSIWEKQGIYSSTVEAILSGEWESMPHPLNMFTELE